MTGWAIATESATSAERFSGRLRIILPIALMGLLGLLVILLAAERTHLGYTTETDLAGAFVPEAKRVLAGEPLRLEYHPPLYALVLALVRSITGDWMTAGLLIAAVSALLAAGCCFWLMRALLGYWAGVGALAALLGSPVFVKFAAMATSDVCFLALFLGACTLAVAALRQDSNRLWLASGVCIGGALLSRSNAITLVLLAILPLIGGGRRGWAPVGAIILGIAAPLAAWLTFALLSDSELMPAKNHLNLAMTYFASSINRISNEAMVEVTGRFDGLLDVVLHDPGLILKTYLRDLVRMTRDGLPALLAFPLNLLFAWGLLAILVTVRRPVVWAFVAVVAAQLLLVNLKAFEPRYYLFVLPLMGAGLGVGLERLLASTGGDARRTGLALALGALALVAATGSAVTEGRKELAAEARELSEVVPEIIDLVGEDDLVVARKPHLAFYSGAAYRIFPDASSVDALRDRLCATPAPSGRRWLFVGEPERGHRPGIAGELLAAPPAWLQRKVSGVRPGPWAFYAVTACGPEGQSRADVRRSAT